MIKNYEQLIYKIAKNLEECFSFMNITYKDIKEMIMIVIWDLAQRNLITEENIYNNVLRGCYKIIKEQVFYEDYTNVNNFIRKNTQVTSNNIKNKNCLRNILNFFNKINLQLNENMLETILNNNKNFEDLLYSFFANSDNQKPILKNINDLEIKKILDIYIKIRKLEDDEFFKEDKGSNIESTVDWYNKQINNHPIYTKEEELEVFKKYNQAKGEEKTRLKKEIASHYLKLVVAIANKYNNKYLSLDDLIEDANVGLIKAIDKYDVNKGNRFFTLAIWYIRLEITIHSYEQSRCMRLPVYIQTKLVKFLKYEEEYIKKYNKKPTDTEMASLLNVEEEIVEVIKIALQSQNPKNLYAPFSEENENTLLDIVPNEEALYPQLELEKTELKLNLKKTLEELSVKEKQIILIKYGFIDGGGLLSNAKTANILYEQGYTDHPLSSERIRQLENRALKKLRKIYSGEINFYLPETGMNK